MGRHQVWMIYPSSTGEGGVGILWRIYKLCAGNQEAAGDGSGSRAEHGVCMEERMSLGLNKSEVP